MSTEVTVNKFVCNLGKVFPETWRWTSHIHTNLNGTANYQFHQNSVVIEVIHIWLFSDIGAPPPEYFIYSRELYLNTHDAHQYSISSKALDWNML